MLSTHELEVVTPVNDIVTENQGLKAVRDRMKALKDCYDSVSLSKEIKVLQEASRIQNMRFELRDLMLKELTRRKLIKSIVDGEFIE